MAWHRSHKQQTKECILSAAAKCFLEQGYQAVSINEIMHEANLTRGAFYHHFSSKLELYEQAIHFALMRYSSFFQAKANLASFIQFLKRYLDMDHASGKSLQCPLVYLSTDILRNQANPEKYQAIYRQVFEIFVRKIEEITQNKCQALAITSLMIGAVTMARAINDRDIAQTILHNAYEQIINMINHNTIVSIQ